MSQASFRAGLRTSRATDAVKRVGDTHDLGGVLVIVFLAGIFLYVTIRNHEQDNLRSHSVDMIRLSGVIENDIAALESGLTFESPEGSIRLDPKSHHVVHSVHLAKVNDKNGFSIMESFANVEPADTMKVCDLIANPNEHKQYTPKY